MNLYDYGRFIRSYTSNERHETEDWIPGFDYLISTSLFSVSSERLLRKRFYSRSWYEHGQKSCLSFMMDGRGKRCIGWYSPPLQEFFDGGSNNLGQNICRLFNFLAQFVFTTSETEVDYYHQKVNVRFASRVAERLKILGNKEISRKSLKYFNLMASTQLSTQKPNFLVKNCKKSAVKHSVEKSVLFNFLNLSPAFCSRLPHQNRWPL